VKKLFSILFAFLILLSAMHVTIASHHCSSADETFEKISVTGELASCGMEGCDDKCSTPGNHFEEHCCDNSVSILAINHDYAPSSTEFTTFAQHILQVYIVPVSNELHSLTSINLNRSSASPPSNFLVHTVSLPTICVFLI